MTPEQKHERRVGECEAALLGGCRMSLAEWGCLAPDDKAAFVEAGVKLLRTLAGLIQGRDRKPDAPVTPPEPSPERAAEVIGAVLDAILVEPAEQL